MGSDRGRFAPIRRVMRWVSSGVALAFGGVLVALGPFEHRNAIPARFPAQAELRERFSRAANWIVVHGDQVLSEDNPMLFVREASRLRSDPPRSRRSWRAARATGPWRGFAHLGAELTS